MTSAMPMQGDEGPDPVRYQLSYQASWKLVTLLVRNIPVKDELINKNI